MKTFRTADGRRVPWTDEQQIREAKRVAISAVLAPVLTIIFFAWAGGMIP